MEFDNIVLPAYAINLEERTDRRQHLLQQFEGKREFHLQIVSACRDENSRVGLWKSIIKVIQLAEQTEEDVILLCEDDHTFTTSYNRDFLFKNIVEAASQGAELLSGGIGGFNHAFPITRHRYWIDAFWCSQFLILYRPIFRKILDAGFQHDDTADGMLSEITSHKMVLYPFVSVQIDFGYSDVTVGNHHTRGLIANYFRATSARLEKYQQVYDSYLSKQKV
ncbi:glycosyl transferase family 25 [Chitinophaga polysaccharea]|uniref:Glycosyl transferase family 25 n=1 Tax=Chitinophaga polysaccharea TaxID=1293035 RepID=A0A561PRB2_9BACT|nr:glycosyl transferase [Chitinophaga polysaccharea]TWF40650.1 glycosyl transferase family 25 [Chitinophaga polysaccharea]